MKESIADGIRAALLPELAEHGAALKRLFERMDASDERMQKLRAETDAKIEKIRVESDAEITRNRRESDKLHRESDKLHRETAKQMRETGERLARQEEQSRAIHAQIMSMKIDTAEARTKADTAQSNISQIFGHLDWGRRLERLERKIEEEIIPRLP